MMNGLTPNHEILSIVASISKKLGQLKFCSLHSLSPESRIARRVDTVHASLRLDGPALSREKIEALAHQLVVHRPAILVRRASNLLGVYASLNKPDPLSQHDFRNTHSEVAMGIEEVAGEYRTIDAGIFRGNEPIRLAPPPGEVGPQMAELFEYLNHGQDPWLIKACLCHYRVESLQPFEQSNGIMGRLWQTLLLMKETPIFEFLPLDPRIHEHKQTYFRALTDSNNDADPTKFLHFMLGLIDTILFEYMKYIPRNMSASERILSFHEMGMPSFTRKDYMGIFTAISPATASRDLEKGVNAGLFKKTGTKNCTRYACQKP